MSLNKLACISLILLSFFISAQNAIEKKETECNKSLLSGDYNQALVICSAALSSMNDDNTAQLYVLLQLATIHHKLGQTENEDYYLAKIKSHPKFIEVVEIQHEWHRRVGQKYYYEANYEESKRHLYQALEIAKRENNPVWLSKSYNDVGLVELKLENYKTALSHYQQSLQLKKKHGNSFQIGKTLNNLGLVHFKLEMYADAVLFYEDALTHYLNYAEQPDFDERVYYEITHIYEDLNRAHQAIGNDQKAEAYAKAILDSLRLKISPLEQTRALLNLSKWHLLKNNDEFAQLFIDEANHLLQQHGNKELMAELYWLQSQTAWHQSDFQSAETNALKGLKLAQELKNDQLTTNIYSTLGTIYQDTYPRKALEAMQQYQNYRESFLKKKYDSDLRTIQHEIEKQQIQQKLLSQELINIEQKHQLKSLTNLVLWIVIITIIVIAGISIYLLIKRKEKESLLKSIYYHKQQLLLLEATQSSESNSQHSSDIEEYKDQLKHQLVNTMIDVINIWEKTTQSSQIELAEQSKIWTVSIDNGTLRTRSLDKYLSVDKIPQNPRWRNVVKTCHFILSQIQLSAHDRQQLNNHLDSIMNTVKNLSLGSKK